MLNNLTQGKLGFFLILFPRNHSDVLYSCLNLVDFVWHQKSNGLSGLNVEVGHAE